MSVPPAWTTVNAPPSVPKKAPPAAPPKAPPQLLLLFSAKLPWQLTGQQRWCHQMIVQAWWDPPRSRTHLGRGSVPSSSLQQAARSLLEGVNQTSAGRRLRRQQERAQRKGTNKVRWGQAPPLRSPLNFQLPVYLRQVGSGEGENLVLVIDSRDQRLQSPTRVGSSMKSGQRTGWDQHPCGQSPGEISKHGLRWPEAGDLWIRGRSHNLLSRSHRSAHSPQTVVE